MVQHYITLLLGLSIAQAASAATFSMSGQSSCIAGRKFRRAINSAA